jgi:hypothetical protein
MKTIFAIFQFSKQCFLLICISFLVNSCCEIKRIFNKDACQVKPECTLDIPSYIVDIAKENAPIVFLHEDDKYGPASVDWYLQRVELRHGKIADRNNPTESTELIVA